MRVPENIGYTQWLLLMLFSVYASTGKYRLHSMASLAAVFGLCKYRKISVTLNGFSCCCFRFMQVPENIGYTQWLLLLLFSVYASTGKYRLHSMASLAAVFGLCKYRKISVTLNGFFCCCFRFMQVPENIGYTQWLLLLLFSVQASTMSELQTKNKTKQKTNKQTKKQKHPPPPPTHTHKNVPLSPRQLLGWDIPLLVIYYWKNLHCLTYIFYLS